MTPEKPASGERRFHTVSEVAQMLRLHDDDVVALLESGEVQAIRVGPDDEWRIEADILDDFLEGKYEESRRRALWNGFDFGSVVDVDPTEKPRHPRD